ncbi:hypothetical protein [Methylogaea oryzae]|uniref:Uncharacterized protein n=1 Tax=Methylogaea oryzae TaxID=1295382 RepID=A0A8D4VR91_9GAMM|nr:hypothetical protein [Methylogaea oryzae]BBL72665.1 hypothetical protein MoryE10_32710 [Methylogaea oryzae]
MRQLLAQEAARLMVTESIDDYQWAKEKAAQRLGVRDKSYFPRNDAIDQAAQEYARLFAADTHAEHLERLRKTGLEAMEFLQAFDPHLTGGAASGTASAHTPILLELYADTPEQVMNRLLDASIPFSEQDAYVGGQGGKSAKTYPKLTFLVNDASVELLIFPPELRHQKMSGKDTPRLSLKQLREVLAKGE